MNYNRIKVHKKNCYNDQVSTPAQTGYYGIGRNFKNFSDRTGFDR